MPNPKEQSYPERVFPQRPDSRWIGPVTKRWFLKQPFQSKEDVHYFLSEVIHFIHDQGFFISGQIEIDDKRSCGNCNTQMIWMAEFGQHRCPRCMAMVIEAVEGEATYNGLHDLKNRSSILSDCKICTTCGGLCVRTGTCYTCQDCGTNEGCG